MDNVVGDRAVLPATHGATMPATSSLVGSKSANAVHLLSDSHATGRPSAARVATVKQQSGSVRSVWSALHTLVLAPAPVHNTSVSVGTTTCSSRRHSHHNWLSLSPTLSQSPSSCALLPLTSTVTAESCQVDVAPDQAAVVTSDVVSRHSLDPSCPTSPSPVELNTQANVAAFECAICLDQVSHDQMFILSQCLCRFCKHCVETYVACCLRDGESLVSCPSAKCEQSAHLTSHEVQVAISHDTQLQQLYRRISYIREVDGDPGRVWCPRADCDTACAVSCSDATTFLCPRCQQGWCVVCRAPRDSTQSHVCRPHVSATTCDTHVARVEIKACPVCGVLIERDEGCAQIMCRRCRHVFCWYCLQSLDGDFFLRHYDYSPCRELLGHSRRSLMWHRVLLAGVMAVLSLAVVLAVPVLLLISPVLLCCSGVSQHWSRQSQQSATNNDTSASTAAPTHSRTNDHHDHQPFFLRFVP